MKVSDPRIIALDQGASGGIVYKRTAAFRSDLSLSGGDLTFERESRRGGVHVAPIACNRVWRQIYIKCAVRLQRS